MITLQLSDLRNVEKRFSAIRQRNILPILNFIKIESSKGTAKITKDNLDVFIIQAIPSTGEGSLLVHESTFWNFVGFAQGESIKIEYSKKDYTISCGNTKITNQLEEITLYPVQRSLPKTGEIFDPVQLGSLSSLILEEEIPTQRSFVFAGDGKATASDGFVGYCVDYTGPKISLKKANVNLLPKQTFEYAEVENYDYFLSENVSFGFIKSEVPFFDVSRFFKLPAEEGFELDKNYLIRFNDLAIASGKSKSTVVSWEGKKLSTHDDITNNSITGEAPIEATFMFLAEQMNKLLKSIPYDTITFIPGENKYYISTPDGGVGLIMQAAK